MTCNRYIPHAILSLVAFVSYLILPFTDDLRVFFGVAKIADSFGSFPMNVDLAWELKPLGNRMLYYAMYKAFTWVNSEILFEITVKVALAVAVGLICYYFALKIKEHYGKPVGYAAFFILLFSLFALDSFCIMEPEWFAVILSFLALAILMSNDSDSGMIVALIFVAIVSLKGITILLIPAVLAAWYLLGDMGEFREKTGILLFWFSITTFTVCALSLGLFPNAIPDTLLAGQIAFSVRGVGYLDGLMYTLYNLIKSIYFIPAILAGCVATIGIALRYIPLKDSLDRWHPVVLTLLWAAPLAAIFIQGEYFSYHYTLLIFPAVISMIEFVNVFGKFEAEALISFGLILIIAVVWFQYPSIWGIYYQDQVNYWDNLQGTADRINAEYGVNTQPRVLYMDAGNAPYYFAVPSECRYIQPLPVWRDVHNTAAYHETRDCILNYRGEYIISTPGWVEHDPNIRQSIQGNYSMVFHGWWDIWQKQ